jgi:hypothetical protein
MLKGIETSFVIVRMRRMERAWLKRMRRSKGKVDRFLKEKVKWPLKDRMEEWMRYLEFKLE